VTPGSRLLSGLLFDIKNTPADNAGPQWEERRHGLLDDRTLLADVRNRLWQPGDNASVLQWRGHGAGGASREMPHIGPVAATAFITETARRLSPEIKKPFLASLTRDRRSNWRNGLKISESAAERHTNK